MTEQEGTNAEAVIHGANLELMLASTNPVKAVTGFISTLLAIFALLASSFPVPGLPACLSPPYMNSLPSSGRSLVPIPQGLEAYMLPVKKCSLFPRTQSRASGFASALCLLPKVWLQGNDILLNLFMLPSSPRQTANKCCILGPITVPLLAN